MAQAPAATPADATEVAPKSNKTLFMILIAVVVLAAGGGAAYFFMGGKSDEASHPKEVEKKPEVYLPMEAFTVNLRPGEDPQQQYLQVVMSLQMPTEKDVEKIKERMPEVRNRILFVLSSKKAEEISTTEGKEELIKEITKQVNEPFFGTDKTQNVSGAFFTSFIIQ